jgi:raffinose/stachyose/melibiose transport system substrate-binding protein
MGVVRHCLGRSPIDQGGTMSPSRTKSGLTAAAATAMVVASLAGPTTAQDVEPVTLSLLVDTTEVTNARVQALTDAYTTANPNVAFEIEQRPQGAEGDNVVKTRLATGEMTDIFWYNSGSLLQALNPSETLTDISGEACVANLQESYLPTVSDDNGTYGVPGETAMAGGVLYNKAIYEDLGLEVPTTWDEFAANNEAIKEAGIAPIGQTYAGDSTWTSQLFGLADYYNVESANPGWAEQYTNNEAKYATTPAAQAGFERLQQGFEDGWWQEDFGSATYDEGLTLLAEGSVAHYPMLTFALPTLAERDPEGGQNIGFFAQPGDSAESNGATIWMPGSLYIPNTTENVDVAKDFLCFVASVEGTEILTAAVAPSGPYVIKGATLPDDVLPAVQDIQAYIDAGASAPALEFLSPLKGPALEQITVEVGSGLRSAADAAALYDEDVQKQAQQLGIPGWE